jgi:hypothetical protein
MFRRFYRNAVTARDADNPFAPVPAVWGARFFERALASGHGALLPDGELLRLADRVVTECSSDITA